jgi:lipase chaperone LimK
MPGSSSFESGAVTSPEPPASVQPDDVPHENNAAFRTDAAGELVVDEQTRLNMEALIAQTEAGELYREVREQTEHLPPTAARDAEELVQKFVQYQHAQRQTYPPRDAPVSEDEAIRELEALHALRQTHFGAEVAAQLYGHEERIAREMIEVMRIENDQSLTPAEKLARAQAIREHLPGVAAIEKRNRESAVSPERDGDE